MDMDTGRRMVAKKQRVVRLVHVICTALAADEHVQFPLSSDLPISHRWPLVGLLFPSSRHDSSLSGVIIIDTPIKAKRSRISRYEAEDLILLRHALSLSFIVLYLLQERARQILFPERAHNLAVH